MLAHTEVSLGLQRHLNKRELGHVAMTRRFALDFLAAELEGTSKSTERVDLQGVWAVGVSGKI